MTLPARANGVRVGTGTVPANPHWAQLQVSWLEALLQQRWEGIMLNVQRRTVHGGFDLQARLFYPEYNVVEGVRAQLPPQRCWTGLRQVLRGFGIRGTVAGTVRPVAISVAGTRCEVIPRNGKPTKVNEALLRFSQRILLREILSRTGLAHLPPGDVAVILPYRGQKDLSKRILEEPEFAAVPNIRDLLVGSIDELQGRERQLVILVMTATAETGPGFTANKGRLNVALSRAVEATIMITDADVMRGVGRMARTVREDGVDGGGRGSIVALRAVHDTFRRDNLFGTAERL